MLRLPMEIIILAIVCSLSVSRSVWAMNERKKCMTYRGFFNMDATKIERQGQQTTPYFLQLFDISFSKVCHFMMETYTNQQRVEIIKMYYRNSESVASTLRALRPIYGAMSSLWSMPTSQRRLMNFLRILSVKLQQYRPIYARKSSKIASVPCKRNRVSFMIASNVLLQE